MLREDNARALAAVPRTLPRETEEQINRIRTNAQAEIEALRVEASRQVRRHTAQLALSLAERRLRDRFSAGEPQDLLHDFVHLVEQSKNR